jgi:hypothetical protein
MGHKESGCVDCYNWSLEPQTTLRDNQGGPGAETDHTLNLEENRVDIRYSSNRQASHENLPILNFKKSEAASMKHDVLNFC